MKLFAFLFVLFLNSHVIFTAITQAKNCVLDVNGIESCKEAPVLLPAAIRQSAPCAKMDMKCWCLKAAEYTNDVRRRHGVSKKLKVGPMKQLDNAEQYAGVLGDKGFLEHQNLGDATRKVGCGRFIGGENIAYNYASGDVAKACLNQWEGSSGHLQNILRDRFEEVVVGFHFEPDGRVYCVQTFAQMSSFGTTGSPSDRGCEPVSPGSEPGPTRPPTTRPPTTRPATTRPTSTRPVTRPPPTGTRPPRKPRLSRRLRSEANRSCRCIELGTRCWLSLRAKSGNRCNPLTPSRMQPKRCLRICCFYCRFYPNTPPCKSGKVKLLCRSM